MLKYLVLLCLAIGATVYVTRHDKSAAQDRAQKSAHLSEDALAAIANKDHSQQYIEEAKRYAPSWYSFFRWPDGTTACAVILTLLAIAEQTNETRKAAVATQAAAAASLKQVDLMAIQNKAAQDKERARLSLIFPPANHPTPSATILSDEETGAESRFIRVAVEIVNYGETNAFNVRASGYVRYKEIQVGEVIPQSGFSLTIPNVIGDATAEYPVTLTLSSYNFGHIVFMTSENWQRIESGINPLMIIGNISYEDVFGNPRSTPFHFEWRIHEDNSWGDLEDRAKWTDHSSASD